jgi:DNA-binding transcriptional regulator YiaG
MPDRFVRPARTRLDVAYLDLARKLGVTVGCLRSWDRKGAPR